MNDVYELNPENMSWANLTSQLGGDVPSTRSSVGFAAANNRLYLFGGLTGGKTLSESGGTRACLKRHPLP